MTRPARYLVALLTVAFAVSVVHYTDNYVNYADYPQPTSGPSPSRGLVGASWFLFTAFGVAGLVSYLRGNAVAAAACLAVYSASGLVGLGHYTVDGATDMPWWRQAHVIADIVCGILVFAFAWRTWRATTTRPRAAAPR